MSRSLVPSLLCLALYTAAGQAMAAEVSPLSAASTRDDCPIVAPKPDPQACCDKSPGAQPQADTKGAGDARTRTPRWHRFLPGMIR